MLVFLAICYAFLIWAIYFKFELLPYDKKNKIISTSLGVVILLGIFFITLIVSPYTKNFVIAARVNSITPRVAGEVTEILVEPGKVVQKDEPLIRLSTRSYDLLVEEAKGNMDAAESAYRKAKKQREIALGLEKADPASISQLQLINTEETLNQLKGQLENAKSSYEKALHDLSKTTIYSPAKGFTPYIPFENKTSVAAYAPLMTFVSLDDLYPVSTYPQKAISLVQPGDEVEFLLDLYPGKIFKAKVNEVVWAAGEAQVFQGQSIPQVDNIHPPSSFLVKMTIEELPEDTPLRFGAKGEAVIYTKYWHPFHIIQKVHLRMQSLLNYLSI